MGEVEVWQPGSTTRDAFEGRLRDLIGVPVRLRFPEEVCREPVNGRVTNDHGGLWIAATAGPTISGYAWAEIEVLSPAGIYAFRALCSGNPQDGYRAILPGRIPVIQRRGAVRVPLVVPVIFRLLEYRGMDLSIGHQVGHGTSRDISASGIGMVTELRLEPGLVLGLMLDQQPWSNLGELRAVVMRVEPDAPGRYVIGCRFYGNDTMVERSLIRLIREGMLREHNPPGPTPPAPKG